MLWGGLEVPSFQEQGSRNPRTMGVVQVEQDHRGGNEEVPHSGGDQRVTPTRSQIDPAPQSTARQAYFTRKKIRKALDSRVQ